MTYNKKIIIFYIVLVIFMGIFLSVGRTSGTIQHKFIYMRFSEPVYCFVIKDKLYEAGYLEYDRYNIGDYYEQGLLK